MIRSRRARSTRSSIRCTSAGSTTSPSALRSKRQRGREHMQSRRHAPETEDTGIDLAPMLDFTVNLLIFFIITTSFIKEAGVTVFKPSAVTGVNRDSGNLLIAIRENGDIWMDRRRIELREVRPQMERLHIE